MKKRDARPKRYSQEIIVSGRNADARPEEICQRHNLKGEVSSREGTYVELNTVAGGELSVVIHGLDVSMFRGSESGK